MKCMYCGKKMDNDAYFCDHCGRQAVALPQGMPQQMQRNYPNGMPQQRPGRSQAGFIIFVIVMDLLILLEILLFLAPGFVTKKHREEQIRAGLEASLPVSTEEMLRKGTEGKSEEKTEEITELITREKTEEKTEAVTEEKTYSTTERPVEEEFRWYLDDVYQNGMPASAKPISDPYAYEGGWKCLFWWDPENMMGAAGIELANVDIQIAGEDSVTVTVDQYWIRQINSEPVDESTKEPYRISCHLMQGRDAYGAALESDNTAGLYFILDSFYTIGDVQYALGQISVQSGEMAMIALVRP